MRVLIETVDTVREVNRWEIADVADLIPDWAELGDLERLDRVTELIGEGAEFCKNLEADTVDREVVAIATEEGES